jgi:hypothetical protein
MNTKFPDGWVPPVLTESWSPALSKNYEAGEFQLFAKELGFTNGGNQYSIPKLGEVIAVGDNSSGGGAPNTDWEVSLVYYTWGANTYEESQKPKWVSPESYQIPIISMQLAKFYFGNNWRQFYNYLVNGQNNKVYTFGNRQVNTTQQEVGWTTNTAISYPWKTLNGKQLK